jgi:hypothetical protein
MKMKRSACLALAALSLASAAQAAPLDESNLPLSLRRGYVGPVIGPADDRAYARGALGLVRPSYGRASLFVAWRVIHLPVGAVASERHDRKGGWVFNGPLPPAPAGDEIEGWLQARNALMGRSPEVAPAYFRKAKLKVAGFGEIDTETGQCGPDAYAFATRTLRDLTADGSLQDADRRAWVTRQDAVFARCTWTPGKSPVPALPAPLPAGAPAKLQALYTYQRAAALFYADDYLQARQEFDAIAATADHPMRPWATLGALRSIVREAVRDAEWNAAVDEAWNGRQLRGAAFQAAVAEPAARHRTRVNAALKDIDTRAKAAKADATLAPVKTAVDYTARRGMLQLAPMIPLGAAMNALDRPDYNPYVMGALDLFQETYPRVAPDRPEGNLATSLRTHAWFDFIVTVQGCTDVPAPNAAVCDGEHVHALARWLETKDNAWLLASLMTVRQPVAADLLAAEAARAVPADRPEWASLQFYAARVLRSQGRSADARAALDALAASTVVHKRDRELVEAERRAL